MKKILPLLLGLLLLTLAIPLAALAFGDPTPSDTGGGFGSSTGNDNPGGNTSDNNNSGGDTSGGDNSGGNTSDNNNSGGNTSDNNNSGGNTSDNSNSGGNSQNNSPASNNTGSDTSGNTIVDTYSPADYITEKTQNQQIIEEAQQQYSGPRLAGLNVGGLSLIPAFSSETFYYTAYVPEEQTSVSISASTAAASSTVYIDGMAGSSRQISIGSAEKTVRIIITSGSSSTTYTVLLLRNQQVQAIPQQQIQLNSDFPVLTHVRLENADFLYEQDIYTTGGDIYITLPNASKKSFSITLSANIEVVTYCNNIRVYNVVYNTNAGAWQWKRQYIEMRIPETRLEIFLANKGKLDVVNTYNLILRQPTEALNIQLQVGNTEAMVNDAVHTLDAPPVIMEGHTMVPLRFIAEALGAQVSWESAAKRVELDWQGQKLELFIGQLTDNMPQAPFIENGRTMVPLRYVSEKLNCQVEWVAATKEIIITR